MTELEAYYNKFNEEKRLNSRHGQVEYRISMKYIHIYLDEAAKRLGAPAQIAEARSGCSTSEQAQGATVWCLPRRAMMSQRWSLCGIIWAF